MKTTIKQNYSQGKRGFYQENKNTLVSTERNYLKKSVYEIEDIEDPIEDDHYEINGFYRNENIPNEKRVIDEDDPITNDDEEDQSDDFHNPDDLEEDNEKEDDEIDKTSEEFYPENNPRQF